MSISHRGLQTCGHLLEWLYYLVQCLGDGGKSRVLASVFVCLKNFMIFLKFVFIFVLFIRFPSSNELCPKVYCLILENAIQFVRMCIAVS